ncbi:hypothetical protein F01_500161 [Burkholderia cenocepacia]|nr:hypothetical protein F01_500161 [Burkholderia cenocepacia]
MGRLGAEDDSGADARRPRIRRRDRRDGAGSARLRDRRSRVRRRSHHVRFLPQLSRRAPASVPQHGGRRREPRRRVRRIPGDSGIQRVQDSAGDFRRSRVDLRSVRQRDAHGVVVQPRRRGRADHRRGPDRHHGRRDRQARRRAQRRHHRYQRLSARARAQDGRDAGGQRRARVAARRDGRPAHDRRLRRRSRDVGRAERVHEPARGDEPRRQGCVARHPARADGDRLEPGDLQGARDQGHLRPRDVRDLVQDGRDAAERPRPVADHHAPLRGRRLRARLRRDAVRRKRQGDSRLDRLSRLSVETGQRGAIAACPVFVCTRTVTRRNA